ncbi:rCG62270 [Rattus norvegicus]|uniref:RCG62270 n=1 Tax=Rattus norvegicus TaxID=10116 RepID=A6H9M1_RAT|nr:rCG62270 [Rattus norvegicus]
MMFRGLLTNSHLFLETMNRTMHSAVNQPMQIASIILSGGSLPGLAEYLLRSSRLRLSAAAARQSGSVLAHSTTIDTITNTTDTLARICAASDDVGSSKVRRMRSSQRREGAASGPVGRGCSRPSSSAAWKVWVSDMRSSRRRWQQYSRCAPSRPQ